MRSEPGFEDDLSPMTSKGRVARHDNRSTHAYVRMLGTAIALTGASHGLYELRRGDRATGGHVLTDIGAFTLLPGYRATGIAAIATSLAVAGWTVTCTRSRRGPSVFLLLSAASFLLGGGIAQVPASL